MSSLRPQNIIDEFCILYEVTSSNGYPGFKRSIHKPLRSRMEKLVQLHPEWQANHYLQYFLGIINDDSQLESERQLAHLHLVAYFDLSRCHFVRQFSQKFPFPTATCIKFFELTTDVLYNREQLKKCLNGYDAQDASGANLKTYLQGVLKNVILDQIKFESSWHLLCNVELSSRRKFNNAQQKLREALLREGIVEPDISRYLFAWQYFVPVYKNNRLHHPNRRNARKWPEPEPPDFAETARDYNTNRFQPDAPLQVSSSPEVMPELIRKWLNICIDALQNSTRIVEIDHDVDGYDQQYNQLDKDWQPLALAEESVDFFQQVDPFFQDEIQRIEHGIEQIRSKIPREVRKAVMPLCYPQELALLVQEQLANKIGVNQGTVARYIANNYKAPLLRILDNLIKEKLGSNTGVWVSKYVEDFLKHRFSNPNPSDLIELALIDAIQNLEKQTQLIIKLHYGQRMTVEEITVYLTKEKLNKSSDVAQVMLAAKQELEEAVITQINTLKINCANFLLKRYYRQVIHDQLLENFRKIELVEQELIRMKFCQKMTEVRIAKIRPNCHVKQAISTCQQQLQNSLMQWSYDTFRISLEPEKEQVSEVVEIWLKTLYAVEL
ncbi:MAG: XRE family transcriptional regulator [Symploca sp. SIO1A3]|nr:XRE family transcriptional regulator [Symploca sp. SIO1A3]